MDHVVTNKYEGLYPEPMDTGLGLRVSLEITERHGGSLTVRSSQRDGEGGTVCALFLAFAATTR